MYTHEYNATIFSKYLKNHLARQVDDNREKPSPDGLISDVFKILLVWDKVRTKWNGQIIRRELIKIF